MINLNKLKNLDTPARYTGGEARQYVKNISNIDARVCVAVPAVYEMGMFDFEQKAIYYVLNNKKNVWCERAFAPMPDFEALLKETNENLYTLESKTSLKEMDVITFVLSNELMYTNLFNMLNLGAIPVLKDARQENSPLIIATGSAVLNPKPLEAFVDIFIVGEASLVIEEIIDKVIVAKKGEEYTKGMLLDSIKDIPGVYIPSITTNDVYMVRELDIDSEEVPKNVVIPSIATMMDKSIVVLSKGCDKNCIMCTHKYAYGKPEYMSVDKGIARTKDVIRTTGNIDVMLMTNCYGTYPGFPDIIYRLNDLNRPKIRSLSFMEVKLNKENLWLLKYMEDKENYPEIIVGAPTEALRKKLGIEIKEQDVLDIAKEVFEAGFNKLRLKYIIGIPTETYEDLGLILNMANKICKVYKEVYSKSPDKYIVEINICNFKAKPHTPSQWCQVNTSENLELKLKYLKEKNKNDLVVIVAENGNQSIIETMLSRGDEKSGQVAYEAWKQGARHDMRVDSFSMENWEVALNKTGVEIKKYLEEINEKLVLPWDNINIGTTKEELRRIYINQVKGG